MKMIVVVASIFSWVSVVAGTYPIKNETSCFCLSFAGVSVKCKKAKPKDVDILNNKNSVVMTLEPGEEGKAPVVINNENQKSIGVSYQTSSSNSTLTFTPIDSLKGEQAVVVQTGNSLGIVYPASYINPTTCKFKGPVPPPIPPR